MFYVNLFLSSFCGTNMKIHILNMYYSLVKDRELTWVDLPANTVETKSNAVIDVSV